MTFWNLPKMDLELVSPPSSDDIFFLHFKSFSPLWSQWNVMYMFITLIPRTLFYIFSKYKIFFKFFLSNDTFGLRFLITVQLFAPNFKCFSPFWSQWNLLYMFSYVKISNAFQLFFPKLKIFFRKNFDFVICLGYGFFTLKFSPLIVCAFHLSDI